MSKRLRSALAGLDSSRPGLRAVGYLRVSTEEQLQGYGLAYTERKVKAHSDRKGWTYVGTYADEGVSGTLPAEERPDLSRLMADVHTSPRPFDVVIVPEGRAIGRAGRAFWPWVWRLEELGVFVAISSTDIDNTSDSGREAMREEADYAEREWVRLRRRLQGGIQEVAELGGFPGGRVPFGWRIVATERGELPRCEIDAEAEKTVRRALELYKVLRDWSRTASTLNAEGRLTSRGTTWSGVNLRGRMTGRAVQTNTILWRGKQAARDHRGEPVFGRQVEVHLPQLLTPEEAAVFRLPPRKPRPGPGAPRRHYLLTGRLVAPCGRHYGGKPATNGGRTYVCRGRLHPEKGAACDCRTLHASEIEERVWVKFASVIGSPTRMEEMARDWLKQQQSSVDYRSRLSDLDEQIEQQLNSLQASMAVAARLAAARGLAGPEAEEAIERTVMPVQRQLTDLEQHRKQVLTWLRDQEQAEARVRDIGALARTAGQRLSSLDGAGRAEMLAALGVRVRVSGNAQEGRGKPCGFYQWFAERKRGVPILQEEAWAIARPYLVRGRRSEERGRLLLEALLYKGRKRITWQGLGRRYNTSPVDLQVSGRRLVADGRWDALLEALKDLPALPQEPPSRVKLDIEVSPLTANDSVRDHDEHDGTHIFPMVTSAITFTLTA